MSKEAELESFLMTFADELRKGRSPEISFQAAILNYDGALNNELHAACLDLVNGRSFNDVCKRLAQRLDSRGSSIMLGVVKSFVARDARKAGSYIMSLIEVLRENRGLMMERRRTIRSFTFRARALTLACTAVSAFLASLAPFLLSFPVLGGPLALEADLSITIFLLLTSTITSYYAARAVLVNRAYINALISIILFVTTFILSSAFVRSLF